VAVQVDQEGHLASPRYVQKVLLGHDGFWGQFTLISVPSAVEVNSAQIGAVVTDKHTVGVEHGQYMNFVVFTQETCLLLLRCNEVHETLADKTAWSLPWMLPGRHNYEWTGGSLPGILLDDLDHL
jgi:hypothetical protein